MITLEQAYEIAKQHKDNIYNCIEYEHGYGFFCKEDSNFIGGWDNTPVIVMKDGTLQHHTILGEEELGKEIRNSSMEGGGGNGSRVLS